MNAIEEVREGEEGVAQEHPGPCPGHDRANALAFGWPVAMVRALRAGGLSWVPGAGFETVQGVAEKPLAIGAESRSRLVQ